MELSYDDYPRLWDFKEYLPFLVKNHPNIRQVTKQNYSDDPNKRCFNNLVLPELPVPGKLKSVLSSDKLEYTEVVEWNKNENNHVFKAVMHKASFIVAEGTFTLKAMGERKLQRVVHLKLDVKIPLVGGLAAKFLKDQLDTNYKIEAELRSKFAKEYLYQ